MTRLSMPRPIACPQCSAIPPASHHPDCMYGSVIGDGVIQENNLLRRPWRAVDDQDWQYINSVIPNGGRGRFWKQVLAEMRVALGQRGKDAT